MEIKKIDNNDDRYPKRLLEIKNYPKELYVVGNIELLKTKHTIGIVGSRKCSDYGRKVAFEFAKEISENGICIISGMAIGIDGQAHNAAIEELGKTIAVLGCGFNHIYPKENEWLFHKILENCGCVISEYPPNVEVDKKNFRKRNRIISGLSDSILVVEAKYRSGSSITVKYAKEEEKTIYVIPSNIYSSTGIGTNIMIQEGAKLVIDPYEIIKDIKKENIKNNPNDRYENMKKVYKNKKEKTIEKEYLPIYELLSNRPIHINEIAKRLNTTIQEILPIITIMEIKEYIFQVQTNYFIRRE